MKGFLNWCFLSHCEMFCAMVLACCKPPLGHDGCMGWGAWAACGWRGQARTEHHLPAPPPQGMKQWRRDGRWVSPKERFFYYHPQMNMGKMHLAPLPAPPGALTCQKKEL